MNWRYDAPPTEEGIKIFARVGFVCFNAEYDVTMVRLSRQWKITSPIGNAMLFSDGEVDVKAWFPYTAPNPPEKPQDCPFCGASTELFEFCDSSWYAACVSDDCDLHSPLRPTKEEAIKALNRIKVK